MIRDTKIVYIIVIVALVAVVGYLLIRPDYNTEIARQDLQLKCKEVYNESHQEVEGTRYNNSVQSADAVIWSPKTKSCLAYYNVRQGGDKFLFEVWDYTNTDLVLSYSSEPSPSCVRNDVIFSVQNFIYKYNSELEGKGCDVLLMEGGVDLLINFETAMLDLGFRK